uniref:Ionotropic glutamate receptor C-terminal domain-containing protein n=2 Tax=Sipha flava TaxID=143950 RepID=A0A2S2QC04_9HEMI
MIEKPYRYSKTNHLDSICFVVPQAKSLTKMQIVWKTFTFEVWLCMAVTYVMMINYFQFFNKYSYNLQNERKISDPFMTSLQVVLGMGVCSLPKHVAGRLPFVSCSAAFFVIVSLFQASMVTRLSTDTVQKEIDTLEELDQSGLEIRTSLKAVRDSLAMYSYTKSLSDKIDLEKDRRYSVGSNFVFMSRIMNWDLSKLSNYIGYFDNKSIALHVVRECPLRYYLTYPVSLDFPFLDELNDLLIRLQEAGLSSKWRADIQKVEQEYYKPLNTNTSKVLKAYSMKDLWFAFIFLFVGYTLSILVLMFELVMKKIKKYNYD